METTATTIFRNWEAIAKIDDNDLKALIASAKDQWIIQGLQKGFPEFFSDEATELFVPFSLINEIISNERDVYNEGRDIFSAWGRAIERFALPVIVEFSNTNPMPVDVFNQLLSQGRPGVPDIVLLNDTQCMAFGMRNELPPEMEYARDQGFRKNIHRYYRLRLVEVRLINLEA